MIETKSQRHNHLLRFSWIARSSSRYHTHNLSFASNLCLTTLFFCLCILYEKLKYREGQARSQWELSERLVVHQWVLGIFISFLSSWKLLQKQFEPFLPFSVLWYSFPWFSVYGTLRNILREERGKLRGVLIFCFPLAFIRISKPFTTITSFILTSSLLTRRAISLTERRHFY